MKSGVIVFSLLAAAGFAASPKPDAEAVFPELKEYQPGGSILRQPLEDWEGARKRAESDPAWKTWIAERRARVDHWRRNNRDRVEWRAGWYHDFVSPRDGSRLRWTEKIPGEQTQTLSSESGHQVEVTPGIMGGWIFGLRGRNIDRTVEAARLYRLQGEPEQAEWAASQLDFYAWSLASWPIIRPKGMDSRMARQGLDDATWMVALCETARLIRDHADAKRRQRWFENFFKPQVEMLERGHNTLNNIAVWARSAQAHVALLYDDEAMWDRAINGVNGRFGLREQLRSGVTGDWFWHEQSMGYNDYVAQALHPLFLFAGLTGKGDRLREETALMQNLLLAPLYLRFPDGTLPNPADITRPRPKAALSPHLKTVYREAPTSIGLREAAGVRSWDTLLDPPPLAPIRPAAALPPVISADLSSTRFALLKQGSWQVFFHYGQLCASHVQAEALNWSASFNGVVISRDPGTVSYGSPLHAGYYTRGLSHNVPLVNGEGQQPWHPGNLVAFDPALAVVKAEQPKYRPDAIASRTLRIKGDTLVDEATITCTVGNIAGAKPGLALHLQGKPRPGENFRPVADFARGRPQAFQYWKDVRSAKFRDRAEVTLDFPKGIALRVTFSVPGNFTLWQGGSPDYPPDFRSGFYLEPEAPAPSVTFVTELKPQEP
ncbi:MAG: heparinase II/III family protein [Opitutaceae bacterium]|jgi:hypothetical protein|nr:heparinase II/III family protein [Opitutaceae bacterium]